jgi:hypothetical protein
MQIDVHRRKVINILSNVHYVSLVILRIKKKPTRYKVFLFCNR